MSLWFIGYLLLGISLYLGLWIWAALIGKDNSSDAFFIGAADFLFIPIWPLMLPFMIKEMFEESPKAPSEQAPPKEIDPLIGVVGVTVTDLKPSGKVMLNGQEFDAIASTGVVTRGTAVEVIERDNLRVMIKVSHT